MKEDIKYPAILKNLNGSQTVVVYKDGSVYHIDGMFKGEYRKAYNTCDTKNITREYLANTYGKVESKEHAEFIVKLAELHGLECSGGFMDGYDSHFYTFDDCLEFTSSGDTAKSDGEKQITIPLPPKEVEEMSKFEVNINNNAGNFVKVADSEYGKSVLFSFGEAPTDNLKSNGDNLVLGCEDSKCDEWPSVGDEVTWGNGVNKGTVIAINNNLAWVKYSGDIYVTEYVSKLRKPKTPEEELLDDIFQNSGIRARDGGGESASDVAKFLIAKYNITKKP